MAEAYLGEIRMFGGNFAPKGWATCDGQLLAISQNTALFAILGTTYGGNGQTTFALPDLRGRRPVHQGQGRGLSSYTLGEMGGTENATLTTQNMPAHNHPATATTNGVNATATQANPGGNLWAAVQDSNPAAGLGYLAPANQTTAAMASNAVTVAVGQTGNNIPFSILDPFLCVNFIICLEGIFPSRN
jgi:microcystin-dependent protein